MRARIFLPKTFARVNPRLFIDCSSQNESCGNYSKRDARAELGEEFTMANVEGQRAFGWNIDRSGEHAFGEGAASFVLEPLRDAAELIHETGHAGVGGAGHGTAGFDAAENGIGQVNP